MSGATIRSSPTRANGASRKGLATSAAVGLALALSAAPAAAQLPTLTPEDYGRWERLGAFELDPRGRWLVTSVTRVDERTELRVRAVDAEVDAFVLEHATRPVFSGDGRWLAYRKGRSPEEAEEEGDVPDRLGLVDLSARADTVLFEVASFAFRDDGAWLAAQGSAPSDSTGSDLVVLAPATGARTLLADVVEYAWQDEGPLLAATVRTPWGGANSVVLFEPETGTLRTLDARAAEYRSLTWRDGSAQLAVLRSVESEEREDASHDVLVWDDVRSAGSAPDVLSAVGRRDLPDSLRVTEYGGIDLRDEGRAVFVGVRPWEPAQEGGRDARGGAGPQAEVGVEGDVAPENEVTEGETAPESEADGPGPADVQVWHWNDDRILRAQESRARQISRQTLAAVWHRADDRFVVLADNLDEPVDIVADGRWGLVPDYDPYLFQRRFGAGTADWYRVDARTGERTLLGRALEHGVVRHDDRTWVLVYDDDAWSSIDLSTLDSRPIAEGRSFTRSLEAYDYPGPRPSWGIGAWIEGRDEVVLYDEHDAYRARLRDGSLVRLTDGAESGVRYRIVDPDPERGFGPSDLDWGTEPWLSVFDERTKASGYARASWSGGVERLLLEDARVTGLRKAADVGLYALRMERWDDSPDVFVGGENLEGLVRRTETNPFQTEYAWGRAELLDYTTDAGHDLQARLIYPADFREGEAYPLILYQYERLSDNLHAYEVPSERSYYNSQAWSQAGYFVLMPDIVYEPGRPGPSALDAVEHALDAAVGTGDVDPERRGLIGHSWGGYQASYLPTRTDRFAASVAGAAITNFLSFMGAVHWNGGLPETGHWETGQARMAVPYWEDLDGHLESSPANFIQDLETPMLLMHGDEDGVVDFYQGMEFYNYARRAGKEVVLLVYPGADHGLTDEAQQVDYHRRILEWFGHYLKGGPAAKWITEGESWVERGRRIGG
jgi:dipeptidyl aminopeptidase/acylaminoacyl peptidase